MASKTQIVVRSHSQEREWLLNLGNGNIVEGVKHLIEQTKDERGHSDASSLGKREKAKGNNQPSVN